MARNAKLPWVKTTTAKGKRYFYFDTGQIDGRGKKVFKPLPDPSDKVRFGEVYSALLGHRNRRGTAVEVLTIKTMIDLYQRHPKFKALSDGSKKLYTIYLAELERMMGDAPANDVRRDDIVLMIDKRSDHPGAANMLLAITRAMFKWGRTRGHVTNNPCADVEPFETGEHQPWPESLVRDALAADDDRVRLGVHLLYYTAQRIGDVVQMQFGQISDNVICVRQQKTGKELFIPVHKELRREIARTGRQIGPIVVGAQGTGIMANALRREIQAWAQKRQQKIVPHGLRKNAINALLEVGCTVAETAAISGQTLQLVEHYAKLRNQRRLAQQAMNRWEGTDGDSSN
ncbi:site-specific integrase [Sphingobium baderi]|uniref:Tyr recombinase domain-containing protein n=1 Tax=Sphingobium baderi LL03 TaxID=1114964 RepID=T0I9A2_9SPHN|nr:tyrosine-type recombinase/integrase [Sphingobium baderi]EQB06194.1 hypothetical protein L485_00770 [Sphingobium baderi LL03]KMS62773.1 hypothetical protein V475_06250 [Sphingobium baderi LL03]